MDEQDIELTEEEQELFEQATALIDGQPAQAVGAIPGIPPFIMALLLRYLTPAVAGPLLAFVGKEALKVKVNRQQADALEEGAFVDLGASDNARGRMWSFGAQAGAKRQ